MYIKIIINNNNKKSSDWCFLRIYLQRYGTCAVYLEYSLSENCVKVKKYSEIFFVVTKESKNIAQYCLLLLEPEKCNVDVVVYCQEN